MRISRTTRSCTLRVKDYGTYQAGTTIRGWLRHSVIMKDPQRFINNHRRLHRFQPKSAFPMTYSLRLRSCKPMGAFIISPVPPVLTKTSCAARPLCSTGVTPLHRYYEPSRHRLAFTPFPGVAGYRSYLASADFSVGARTASPVA